MRWLGSGFPDKFSPAREWSCADFIVCGLHFVDLEEVRDQSAHVAIEPKRLKTC